MGKVISMRATGTDDSNIYEIDIQYQNHVYTARLKEARARQLEWPVERPIEFRLDKRIVYLRRHNGEEAKARLISDVGINLGIPVSSGQPDRGIKD